MAVFCWKNYSRRRVPRDAFAKPGLYPRYNNNSYFRIRYSQVRAGAVCFRAREILPIPSYPGLGRSPSKTLNRASRDEIMQNLGVQRRQRSCISPKVYEMRGVCPRGEGTQSRVGIATTEYLAWSPMDLRRCGRPDTRKLPQ